MVCIFSTRENMCRVSQPSIVKRSSRKTHVDRSSRSPTAYTRATPVMAWANRQPLQNNGGIQHTLSAKLAFQQAGEIWDGGNLVRSDPFLLEYHDTYDKSSRQKSLKRKTGHRILPCRMPCYPPARLASQWIVEPLTRQKQSIRGIWSIHRKLVTSSTHWI